MERVNSSAPDDLDRWFAELEFACSQLSPEDDDAFQQAVAEVRMQEKELARKQAASEK